MDSQEILLSELSDGVKGLNLYLNSDDSGEWNLRRVKKFIKSSDFAKRDFVLKRKLYIMFDPGQRVSSDVLKKQVDLYVDLLNEGFDVASAFPEFAGFIENMFKTDINKLSNDKLFAMLHAMDRLKNECTTEVIDEFETKIPLLYAQDIDDMTNRRLSILINYIKDMEFDNLTIEQQGFVIDLFNRCAVKTETSDNNRNKLSTSDWFKDNASNYYSQFNKAFFNVGFYENSLLDEPTKKIRFKYLVKYANLQNAFIKQMENEAGYYRTTVARHLYRSSSDKVYETARNCARNLEIPTFPEYDESSSSFKYYYLREPREYKTSVTSKMLGMFRSMVRYKLSEASWTGDIKLSAQKLSEFVCTNKMNHDVMKIMAENQRDEDFVHGYKQLGAWLVSLVHLDELSRTPVSDLIPPLDKKFLQRPQMPKEPEKQTSPLETTVLKKVETGFYVKEKQGQQQLSFFQPGEEE